MFNFPYGTEKAYVYVNMKAHIPFDSHYMVYSVTDVDVSL